MAIGVGSIIAGYRLLEPLGQGGMGQVFKAAHPRLPRADALKLLNAAFTADPQFRSRFAREADLVAPLNHRNIVNVYDRGTFDDQLWIAMEFIAGTDAAKMTESGPLHPRLAVHIIAETAAGLDYAHRHGLLHRDVKPGNVLITPGDDPMRPEVVKLTDFGIARAADEVSSLTGTGAAVGTLRYSAPEQIEGTALDRTADVYSLGCTLFELLTGSPPFDSPTKQSLMMAHMMTEPPRPSLRNPAVPVAMDRVIATAMAKRPADRYRSCGEFAAAAAEALTGAGTSTQHPRPVAAPRPALPRMPAPPVSSAPMSQAPAPLMTTGASGSIGRYSDGFRPVPSDYHSGATQGGSPKSSGWRDVVRRPLVIGGAALVVAIAAGIGIGAATSSGGGGAPSTGAALTAPDNVAAAMSNDSKYVMVNWDAVPGATEYVVQQGDIVVYAGDKTQFQQPMPLPGQYNYAVSARAPKRKSSPLSPPAPVTVTSTWRELQPLVDLFPYVLPPTPVSTAGFQGISCTGFNGTLNSSKRDSVTMHIFCSHGNPDAPDYTMDFVMYDSASDRDSDISGAAADVSTVQSKNYLAGKLYAGTKQNAGTIYFAPSDGDRARVNIVITVPGKPTQAAIDLFKQMEL
ncbi:serine/threonine-protein kinase [Jongsikchunia kroppenstedtii]|uniref:serine/threonine-protein kinase n=1 Tax=Jongsikchunia kroppenstedtii TaxID=1121721 RepID=UPI000367F8EF|nr:serine/threonine-protein kinase [Jongsikchunia kroppenstedtii]